MARAVRALALEEAGFLPLKADCQCSSVMGRLSSVLSSATTPGLRASSTYTMPSARSWHWNMIIQQCFTCSFQHVVDVEDQGTVTVQPSDHLSMIGAPCSIYCVHSH